MSVWIPALTRNVAALYFSVWFDLSRTANTLTPRLWASTSALAMGAEVKLYACTRICCCAALTSRTTASMAPPLGEKYTATRAGEKDSAACPRDASKVSRAMRTAMQLHGTCERLRMEESSDDVSYSDTKSSSVSR